MEKLFKKLNIKIKDEKLYKQAFSHSSYANEHKNKTNYERLEFLGDAIVDLIVAEYLYNNSNFEEGEMTKLRASYVCENALYKYSIDLGLDEYIKLGNGEEKLKEKNKAIISDVFEALMAAIYLDLGFSTVRRVLLKIVVPYIEDESITFFSDYKSALQEYVQSEQDTISYELIKEDGPAHNKTFTVSVKIDNILYGIGQGQSKKIAEQEAARIALEKVAKIK